jgi:hypothetical protein
MRCEEFATMGTGLGVSRTWIIVTGTVASLAAASRAKTVLRVCSSGSESNAATGAAGMAGSPVGLTAGCGAIAAVAIVGREGFATVLAGTDGEVEAEADIDAGVVAPGVVDQALAEGAILPDVLLMALGGAEFGERAGGIDDVETPTVDAFGDGHVALQAEEDAVAE